MQQRTLVLGIHPTAKGLGWILFENPSTPLDWSILRSADNTKCLRLIDRLLIRLEPSAVVLEEYSGGKARRGIRIQHLCIAITRLANNQGAEVHVYSRSSVQTCFSAHDAKSRHDVAKAVAQRLEPLRHRLPSRRRSWMSEDARLALFDAAALALTHFARVG